MANPSDVAQTVKLTLDREGALNRSEEAECFAGATDQVCPSWAPPLDRCNNLVAGGWLAADE
jgi:hypothetical protein